MSERHTLKHPRPAMNGQRGVMGRPPTEEILADAAPAEVRIKATFKARFRELAALFPTDGETMVVRAQAIACAQSRLEHLKSANPDAIAEKTIACLHLGLELGDQASLVPFKGDVQLIIGPRGLIALAYRSGFVKSIEARSVFAPDMFDYELGDRPFIRHKKATAGRREALITHVYAVIETTTQGTIREVLTAEDIDFYRSFSKATNGPWVDNFEGMCRKTVLKRALEFVPRSPLLATALREDDVGGFEVTDEIVSAIRGRLAEPAPTLAAVPRRQDPRAEVEHVIAEQREMGDEA